jgi:methylase of polypeptide subunit release factors
MMMHHQARPRVILAMVLCLSRWGSPSTAFVPLLPLPKAKAIISSRTSTASSSTLFAASSSSSDFNSSSVLQVPQVSDLYREARDIRILHGHEAAMPYYQHLLLHHNPHDATAATRIAACQETLQRQDQACTTTISTSTSHDHDQNDDNQEIQNLQKMLARHNYTHHHIASFFNVPVSDAHDDDDDDANAMRISCEAPLFVSPAMAGSVSFHSNYPLMLTNNKMSSMMSSSNNSTTINNNDNEHHNPGGLACLITLFLLSLAVPATYLQAALGIHEVARMQSYGWLFPCHFDPTLLVPHVHVMPLDFFSPSRRRISRGYNDNENDTMIHRHHRTLYLVTDLHPRVLATTSVGTCTTNNTNKGNAVMYIGPDSLALVQHFDPYPYLVTDHHATGSTPTNNNNTTVVYHGLDLCTGSGIQALTALMRWNMITMDDAANKNNNHTARTRATTTTMTPHPRLEMLAVDVNPRALKFTQFNAILNGMQDQIQSLCADLVSGRILLPNDNNNKDDEESLLLQERLQHHVYRIVLANPPFLPVPPTTSTATQSQSTATNAKNAIDQRYGLFSSGGSSGEVVLQRILEIASRHLEPGGVLGIVSEFFFQSHDFGFDRFVHWWWWSNKEVGPTTDSNGPGVVVVGAAEAAAAAAAATGVLFVNEHPISPETYASRRADNPLEEAIWLNHLRSWNITKASPGMLYVQKQQQKPANEVDSGVHHGLHLVTAAVPKTRQGSLWTPSNRKAIQYTQKATQQAFHWNQPGETACKESEGRKQRGNRT